MRTCSLNDVIYYANIESNCFSRNKIQKTDENGLVWYRYDKPTYNYCIDTLRIVAIESHSLESVPGVEISVDLETSYHFSDGTHAYESDIDNQTYSCRLFSSEESARTLIDNHRSEHDVR